MTKLIGTDGLPAGENRYRDFFNATSDAILVHDPNTIAILDANLAAEEMFGYARRELIGLTIADISSGQPPYTKAQVLSLIQKVTREGPQLVEWQGKKKTGEHFWIEVAIKWAEIEQKGRILAVIRDISERKRAEQALKESEARLALVLRALPMAFYAAYTSGEFGGTWVSEQIEQISGFTAQEMVKDPHFWASRLHPKDRDRVLAEFQNLKEKQSIFVEYRWKAADGSYKWFLDCASLVQDDESSKQSIVGTWLDITDRKKVEEERRTFEAQLIQQQKLQSIGTLAAGVAHEINNPLNGIMNYAQLISNRLEPQNRLRDFSEKIIIESERVSIIVRDLLSFSRQEGHRHSPASLKDMVDSALNLVRAVMRKDEITLMVNVPENLPKIKCRNQQIRQVLLNLLMNARDALNERYAGYHEGKVLKIDASLKEKDSRPYIRTTVEDWGPGIDPEMQKRIFDPFFTTKPREAGTGLGLSVSYGIVKDHHGELLVESKPGAWTKFHMDLFLDGGFSLQENSKQEI